MINKNISPNKRGSEGKDTPMLAFIPASLISIAMGVKKAIIKYILSRAKI
jgi:hypothetical protein